MKQKLHLIKILANENGIALVVVLLVLIVLSVMGLSILSLATSNMKMSSVERNYESTYYIAESGATYRMNDISKQLDTVYSQATNLTDFFNGVDAAMQLGQVIPYNNFEQSFGQQPTAQTTIEKVPSDIPISYSNDYRITSTGKINNRSRTVTKVFHVTWKPKSVVTIPASTVMFFYGSITLHNVSVTGSLGTNLLSGDSNVKLTGVNTNNTSINYNLKTPTYLPPFPLFSISSTPDILSADTTLTMNRNMSFNNLTVNAGTTLTINVGNVNRSIAVNNLICNGTIKIVGTGKLSIYVKSLSMGSGSIINPDGNIQKLYVFCQGLGSGSSLNNGIIYGSMYATNISSFTINNSNGVQGHLITDATSINLNGSAIPDPKMIYAPYANVNLNATMQGSIIANSISSSGNNNTYLFTFVQINYDNSPLFVDNGTGSTAIQDMITSEPTREIN
ncbi:PilX N-terminal domain-containing pilus assembly protein [Bacillus sp. EB600]|uniref:PilX N-terminal domain-containing pilus assembly protein n=1 Tax=Bacillus sp. EB600 TaxID=2806345 RepID=UPI00210E5479|nr:PilX N-terminal domain-containing pilus assembly protein [Bacillus sp. EB600]MCQ6278273.1 hypothetical protein [Bacillus sp. EB600]